MAADEAIEVFDLLMGDLVRTSGHRADKDRLRTIKESATTTPRAGRLMSDPPFC